jgi:hypothetical protein
MQHLVGKTSNDKPVYVDLIQSQAAPHIAAHPHLLRLVSKTVPQLTITGNRVKVECNLGRVVGYENVVETTSDASILYARIMHDDIYSRFTRKGEPKQTSYITLTLEKQSDESYHLVDTWIGRLRPPRPGSPNETASSRDYWLNHAFLFDNQPTQRSSRTYVCPY